MLKLVKLKKVISSEIHEFVIISEIKENRRICGITCIVGSNILNNQSKDETDKNNGKALFVLLNLGLTE